MFKEQVNMEKVTAMFKLRTDIILLILFYSVIDIYCENDIRSLQVKANFMPNIDGEHLLRGSSEDRFDFPESKQLDDIVPPHLFAEADAAFKQATESDNSEQNAEGKFETLTTQNYEMQKDTVPLDVTQELRYPTTEAVATTETIIPEALSLSLKTDDEELNVYRHDAKDIEESIRQAAEDISGEDRVQNIDSNNGEIVTSVTPVDAVEASTQADGVDETMAVDDSKDKSNPDENYVNDDSNNKSNSIETAMFTRQAKVKTSLV